MKKMTMQQLADSLNLSRVTVWKALNNRPGVAPETLRRVQEAADALGQTDSAFAAFGRKEDAENFSGELQLRNVTLAASRADTSSFWIQIVDQVASELNRRGIHLNYLPIDIMRLQARELATIIQPGKTDGLIVINVYEEQLISALQPIALPKVFFDTIPGHTVNDLKGDLLLLEGQNTTRTITEELLRRGCRRVGFIGDVQYAYTNLLRWNGFLDAMKCAGIPVEPEICLTRSIDKDSYRTSIAAFLDGIRSMPDAFVCVSDFVAFITLNLLGERHFRVPEDLLLSGYDDSREFLLDNRSITTAHVQNALLGKRLVAQLLYRIENPEADFEEIQVMPKIIYRD